MKNVLLLSLFLLCISQSCIAFKESEDKKSHQSDLYMGVLVFNNNNEGRYVGETFAEICNNHAELNSIRVLSKDADITLFMKNINLILSLESFMNNNQEAIREENVEVLSYFTESLKKSYLDKLENSKRF